MSDNFRMDSGWSSKCCGASPVGYVEYGICSACGDHAEFYNDDDFCEKCDELNDECTCTEDSLDGHAIYSSDV